MCNEFSRIKFDFSIEIEHTPPLTPIEKKMIVIFADNIKDDDTESEVYSISLDEFIQSLKVKYKINADDLYRLAINLMGKTVVISRANGGYTVAKWISHIEFLETEQTIEYSIDPILKPYLLYEKSRLKLKGFWFERTFY